MFQSLSAHEEMVIAAWGGVGVLALIALYVLSPDILAGISAVAAHLRARRERDHGGVGTAYALTVAALALGVWAGLMAVFA